MMALKKIFNARTWALLFWAACGAVLFLALSPRTTDIPVSPGDKVNHAAAFFVLTFLGQHGRVARPIQLVSGLLVFGMAIEIIQHFLPYRDFSMYDMLANIAGIVLYVMALKVYTIFLSKKS